MGTCESLEAHSTSRLLVHTPCIDLPHIPSRGDRTRPQWLGRGSSYWHTPMTVSLASAHTQQVYSLPPGNP